MRAMPIVTRHLFHATYLMMMMVVVVMMIPSTATPPFWKMALLVSRGTCTLLENRTFASNTDTDGARRSWA